MRRRPICAQYHFHVGGMKLRVVEAGYMVYVSLRTQWFEALLLQGEQCIRHKLYHI